MLLTHINIRLAHLHCEKIGHMVKKFTSCFQPLKLIYLQVQRYDNPLADSAINLGLVLGSTPSLSKIQALYLDHTIFWTYRLLLQQECQIIQILTNQNITTTKGVLGRSRSLNHTGLFSALDADLSSARKDNTGNIVGIY